GFWGIAQGAITIMLILVGGTAALKALQTASIAAAFPFMLIMLVMCYSIYKGLNEDQQLGKQSEQRKSTESEVSKNATQV
ncbi:MAG: BCCT family transporter, partial [Desulfitobacterium hafniense]|nr:BCCT family transporter [Desulfitobacterium hafniense]